MEVPTWKICDTCIGKNNSARTKRNIKIRQENMKRNETMKNLTIPRIQEEERKQQARVSCDDCDRWLRIEPESGVVMYSKCIFCRSGRKSLQRKKRVV
jgi:hypothetical protein